MNHDPFHWGRPSQETYGGYNYNIANASNHQQESQLDNFPKVHSQQPIITGTSVVSLKFKHGIIMAADNLGSYGSLLRFNNLERLIKVGSQTVVGISGDISDLQQIERILHELEIEQEIYDSDGGHHLRAPHVHEYLSKILYNRRTKMDPLWNAVIVGGFNDDGTPFLKYIDLLGVTYTSSTLATGFGSHLAVPLLRQLIPNDIDYENIEEDEARKVLENCMRVLFYRDARASDKYSLVTIKSESNEGESTPKKLSYNHETELKVEGQSWKFAKDISGYGSKQL
ncbi:B-type subunit of proteasome [Scheffersomyces coipomensis]|uniref:B-type subunit of proteasome n=1 Tax=Scheffersomyces coipomensis TaxID=1788519 RepID=UPI00315DB585